MSAGQWLSTKVCRALQKHWETGGTDKTYKALTKAYESWRAKSKGSRRLAAPRREKSDRQQSLFRSEAQ